MNNDKFVSKTILDKELKYSILSSIPNDYDELEAAIYIYIKLCQIFSYHSEYYIFDGDKLVAQKHENVYNLSTFGFNNNEIICYEFTAIYAKFLDLLNINFKVKYKKDLKIFGGQHTNLKFYINDLIVYADAVTSILNGDLFRSKMALDLVGIQCENSDSKYKHFFENKLFKIYNENKENKNIEYVNNLSLIINSLNLYDKLLMFSSIANTLFKNHVDCMSLMLFLKNIYFSDQEKDVCDMLIVKNNNCEDIYKKYLAFPCMIISFQKIMDEFVYLYIPGKNIKKLSIDEINNLFYNNTIEYKIDNPKRLSFIN